MLLYLTKLQRFRWVTNLLRCWENKKIEDKHDPHQGIEYTGLFIHHSGWHIINISTEVTYFVTTDESLKIELNTVPTQTTGGADTGYFNGEYTITVTRASSEEANTPEA